MSAFCCFRPVETLFRSKVSLASSSDRESLIATSPRLNFEEKLEEANILIDKVRKALKDLGVGQHKALRQRLAITEAEEPVKECSISSNQSKCITTTPCSFQGECCALIVKKAEENLLKMAEEKTGDLKKFEEELRKKVEEEVLKKKEEECQKQLEEALRKQREEFLQKMEEEREKKKKEEEYQKQMEEALRKQREELLKEVEEERERKKKEKECEKQVEEALRKQREELLLKKMEEEEEKKKKEEECQKQMDEALRKQREELLLKKMEEEEEKKNKEEECQKQMKEALRKQREELLQKIEEEQKNKNEEECQKQLEEALRKQREELLQKMEEELEKKKEEMLQRSSPGKQMEDSEKNKDEIPSRSTLEEKMVDIERSANKEERLSEVTREGEIMEEEPRKEEEMRFTSSGEKKLIEKQSEIKGKVSFKSSSLGRRECNCKQMIREEMEREQIPEREIPMEKIDAIVCPEPIAQEENLEWIYSSDKDIIMDKPRCIRSESYELIEEKLKTISELSMEDEEEEEEKQSDMYAKRQTSISTIGTVERACSPVACQIKQGFQSGDARSHCSSSCMLSQKSHSSSILVNEQKSPESTKTASSQKSPKLCIQNLPPVSIRGGLVIQRTLNLTIKPTGSVTNTIGEDRSNVGYQEVIKRSEHGLSCPEGCKDTQGNCKFRVIESLIEAKEEMPHKESAGFINKLNEEAILLLRSYQIYDQHKGSDDRSSATSLANLTHRLLRTLYESQLEDKGVVVGASISEGCKAPDYKKSVSAAGSIRSSVTSSMPSEQRTVETAVTKEEETPSTMLSETNYSGGGGSLKDSRTSSELRADAKDMLDSVLKQSRTPSELGFYKTVATQMSNTSLVSEKASDVSDFIRDGYSREWSVQSTPSSSEWRKTAFAGRKEENVEQMPVVEEEPVRDDSPLEPCCSDFSNKRRVSLMVESSSDDSLTSSRSSEVSVVSAEMFEPPALTQEPRKSILSNKCSVEGTRKEHMKKSVSDTSSEMNTSSSEQSYGKEEQKGREDKEKAKEEAVEYDLSGSSSISGSSILDIKDKMARRSKRSESNYSVQESKQQTKEEEKRKTSKVDQEQQTSLVSSSSTSSTSSSTDKVNTIKSFIQGLTGTSHEKLNQIRSTADFPKSDLQAWSKTVLKSDQRSSVFAPKGSVISERSEKEMGSLSYCKLQTEELEGSDLVMSDHVDDKPPKSSVHDFQKFAKETLKMRRERKEDPVVMMVTEERRMESGEGGNQRNLPFYKRVLGRVIEVEHPVEFRSIKSDPIPLDESVSEGEINCKCTVSSGEVHNCKFVAEKRIKPLKKRPEDGSRRRETNDKSIRLARQRTQYNNWIQYYLQKRKSVIDDVSIASSIDSHE